MCNAGFVSIAIGSVRHARPAINYAWRAGGLNARVKKLSCSTVSNYIDTQGRGAHGLDERSR